MDGAQPASGYLSSARLLAVLTLASRVLGLVRDMAMAQLFGARAVHDAFVLAFTAPNLFRRLFSEGALGVAFIPVFARTLEREGRERSRELLESAAGAVALVLAFACGLLAASCLALRGWRGPEAPGSFALLLIAVLSPYLVAASVSALLGGALNTVGRFFETGVQPVMFNLYWLAGLWWLVPRMGGATEQGVVALSLVLVGAGFLQTAGLAWPLARQQYLARPRWPRDPALAEMGRTLSPMVFGIAVFQVNLLLDRLVAWWLVPQEGALSILYLGTRIMQFPLGIVGVAMGTAVFPVLARLAARSDQAGRYREVLAEAMSLTAFLALPASVGLLAIRAPLVSAFFERDAFTASDAERTAAVTGAYALAIAASCLANLLTRALYSLGDPGAPVRIGLWMAAANLGLDLLLVGPLGELGLAIATTGAHWLCLAMLVRAVQTRLVERGGAGLPWRALWWSALRIGALSAAMAVAVLVALAALEGASRAVRLAVPTGVGLLTYLALAAAVEPAMLRAVLGRPRGEA